MSRPGLVLEVDDRTPPLLISEGAGCRLERLPIGSRVAYPAESLPGEPDVDAAIARALAAPIGQEPLTAQLRAGMKLAISFTDGIRPAPLPARPDPRQRIVEQILELAARAGIDDVHLVAANGLHRKQTPAELEQLVGERVRRSFAQEGRLTAHDAEAADELVEIAPGVRLNRALAEADLIVNVVLANRLEQLGWEQIATGLTGVATAWEQSGRHRAEARDRVRAALADKLTVFQVEAVVDQQYFRRRLEFWAKREWEWNVRDRAAFLGFREVLAGAPQRVRRTWLDGNRAPYGLLGVHAGAVEPVAERSRELLSRQLTVDIGRPADVLIAGPAPVTEHNIGAAMNPLIAAWDVLGRTFQAHTGRPAVRPGGAVIAFHPLPHAFNSRYHAASADFFDTVLAETLDPTGVESKFLQDPWYVNLYRSQHAFHGSHPLELWYALEAAREHCGDIIWVGADRACAERLGFRAASTLGDALEMASSQVGRSPDILHLHTPPALVADVTAEAR